jgi:hypothetical protein
MHFKSKYDSFTFLKNCHIHAMGNKLVSSFYSDCAVNPDFRGFVQTSKGVKYRLNYIQELKAFI